MDTLLVSILLITGVLLGAALVYFLLRGQQKAAEQALRKELAEMNAVNIALFIESLPRERAVVVFRTLPKGLAAEVFSNLAAETQQ